MDRKEIVRSVLSTGGSKCPTHVSLGRKTAPSAAQMRTVESKFVFFMNPARASDGRRARRAGGLTRSAPRVLPATTPVVQLNSCKDVAGVLAESLNQVRRGELDPRVTNAIGYLAGVLLKALEQVVVEDRLRTIEAALGISAKEPGKDEDNNPYAHSSGRTFGQGNK